MTNEATKTTRPPRRALRWVGIIFGGLLGLLVIAYFVATSEWALKSIILPKASAVMNAKVTVDSASLAPFSAVTLRGLKVQSTGTEPLVTATEVCLRYHLLDILKGNLNVDEVILESPVVNLVTFPDGTTNLDPLTKQSPEDKKKDKAPKQAKSEKPTRLDLKKFALNNATVRQIVQRKDGTRLVTELTGVTVTADNLGNDKTGRLSLAANLKLDQGLNSASNGVLTAKLKGNFDLALDASLKPKMIKGRSTLEVADARGVFQQAAGLSAVLNADLTPTQLTDVSVRFAQGGKNLGALTASGPFNAETSEGKIVLAVSQIDRQVLNLAGAALGVDFNRTSINSTNTIELTQRGRMVKVDGQTLIGSFSATEQGQTTPTLDLRSVYALTYDQTNKTALVQTFTLNGTQNNAEFLRGTLAKPMLLEMGQGSSAVNESAFDLVITNFNLPDWRAFLGTNVSLTSGRLGLTLNLVSQQAGKKLTLNLATQLRDLTAASGSNRIANADLGLSASGTVSNFSLVKLDNYQAELAQGGRPALTATGTLLYDTVSQDAKVFMDASSSLPGLLALVSLPGVEASAGTVKFLGNIVQKNTTPQQTNNPVFDRSVVGKLNLDNFTGRHGSNQFDRFSAASAVDLAMLGEALSIRTFAANFQQSGQPGGGFTVEGNYNLASKAGQITAKVTDLNQHTLKSFLAPLLGDKKLEAVSINALTTAKLDNATDGAFKAELHVANLVVNDPSGQVPKTPLALDFSADATMVKQVFNLRSAQVALAKTERAPNVLNLSGSLDMAKSNAWVGYLKITSDGLDVTPYYDLFAQEKPKETDVAPAQTLPATENKPETEPEPVDLPVTQFTQETSIAKFFLREIAISNLVSKTTIEKGRVNVNPFSLTLNGAPVNLTALLNLAVRGYEYDVKAKLDRVPVEPLANTFSPDKRGQFKGDLLGLVQIKGAGVTGPGLQKNLGGQLSLSLTNAAVQVTQYKRLQQLLGPIGTALRVPELAESPLKWIDVRAVITNGTVTIPVASLESSVLRAGLNGTITLASVLTNSTLNRLPVEIALSRNAAERARIAPANTPTNQAFYALPAFVTVGGTVGDPKSRLDSIAVTRILAGTVGNYLGGDAGKILRGLGNFGQSNTNQTTATTNQSSPNAANTNAPAKKKKDRFNLNDLLK